MRTCKCEVSMPASDREIAVAKGIVITALGFCLFMMVLGVIGILRNGIFVS